MQKQFISFEEVRQAGPTLVVDSLLKGCVHLSHWREAPLPDYAWRDDTSAGIALNALEAGETFREIPFITNNHWDIDGFIGVWAMCYPEMALAYAPVLREAALIGDFREFDPDRPAASEGLVLACWLNAAEKRFYPPFGKPESGEKEAIACKEKYAWFLPRFAEVLEHPERFVAEWEPEWEKVWSDTEKVQLTGLPGLGLVVADVPEPVHYYALFGKTRPFSAVLTRMEGQRYELEYKYVTWVQTAGRALFPRMPLESLAKQLSQKDKVRWTCDPVRDTGPMLRPESGKLSKALRYAHPYERAHAASALDPEVVLREISGFFRQCYKGITPKDDWTWKETRKVIQQALRPPGE